jgi:hypothetical protein
VRPRLLEAQVSRQQGQAVAGRLGQQDAGDVEGVDQLAARLPEPGGGQEVDVQRGAVADRLAPLQETRQRLEGGARRRRVAQVVAADAGQPRHRVRQLAPGVGEELQLVVDHPVVEGHRSDLDDAIALGVEPGRLEVEGGVLHRGRIVGNRYAG